MEAGHDHVVGGGGRRAQECKRSKKRERRSLTPSFIGQAYLAVARQLWGGAYLAVAR